MTNWGSPSEESEGCTEMEGAPATAAPSIFLCAAVAISRSSSQLQTPRHAGSLDHDLTLVAPGYLSSAREVLNSPGLRLRLGRGASPRRIRADPGVPRLALTNSPPGGDSGEHDTPRISQRSSTPSTLPGGTQDALIQPFDGNSPLPAPRKGGGPVDAALQCRCLRGKGELLPRIHGRPPWSASR